MYKEYFQETSSVHSYQSRFANMENYLIHRVSSNAGKKINFVWGSFSLE